ncbi:MULTISPECIES: alkaline phosphatase family protein [unclassified Leifsonia]|uniref:alkaline phosphatase family protein n=1 Tax=unclassified Leifsonia TaxID=2663824 RepID=UPI0006F83772|nr:MULTISPECIES: alkaline phosphatase family protein [unclassified Leifsonia]KQX07166.1 hypothetical protein ASC59_05050 [Leifsonia sp. Root1293]KRA11449.1 hypothetical protein ASD61_05050 [Leifsonia sp. Root60]
MAARSEQEPTAGQEPDRKPGGTSRRAFLTAGGIAAAGVIAGGVAGEVIGHERGVSDAEAGAAQPTPDPGAAPGIQHVVVLMGENRSFDNLLGYLYTPDDLPRGQTFDGLAFGEYSNTTLEGDTVAAHVYTGPTDEIMSRPDPDPGEEYPHVNTQLFGTVDPPSNSGIAVEDMRAPFNAPAAGTKPTMSGFLADYGAEYRHLRGGTPPSPEAAAHIMGSFSPEMLPVLSTLARNFALYDAWHCAVPSQTFCNRSFFHASTSHGFVTNKGGAGYSKWLDAPADPTVFNRLEDAGIDWRIYFDDLQLVSLTGVLHAPALEKYWRTAHFAPMSQFYTDVADGKLAPYSFVEPRLIYDHNDFHPPVGRLRESNLDGEPVIDSAVSDVRAGEALVHRIYDAVRTSTATTGSNALNTLLLITFDEHGGTYDHVPPPDATPPGGSGVDDPGEMGFTFDRLGCRVPAIAISAWTASGSVINDPMHHGSLIATLSKLHGLKPLTERDDGAPDILNAVTLRTPRDPRTWPTTTPQYTPPNPESTTHPAEKDRDHPLSPPGRGLVGLLIAKYGAPGEAEPQTYGDAFDLLQKYGAGLFGVPR